MLWHKESVSSDGATPGADTLAMAAVDEVRDGMTVGLGAGKTAARAVHELGRRVRAGELTGIVVVPASDAAETLCRDLGLEIAGSAVFEAIDVLLDGADEVDRDMRMIKGSRGAVARERIIAGASERRVYLVTENKLTDRLGTFSTLAVAVMPFGVSSTRNAVRKLGLNGVLRRDLNGGLLVTDNGNFILDVALPAEVDLAETSEALHGIPGVIDHGLFLDEADVLLIEREAGMIERLERSEAGDPIRVISPSGRSA